MYNNISGKIKGLAQVIAWIGIICSVLVGLVMMFSVNVIIGLVYAALGALFAWVGGFLLYGFGHLIENTDRIVYQMNHRQ